LVLIYSKEITTNLCFLFCKVRPSQIVRDKRELWVAIDKVTMTFAQFGAHALLGLVSAATM